MSAPRPLTRLLGLILAITPACSRDGSDRAGGGAVTNALAATPAKGARGAAAAAPASAASVAPATRALTAPAVAPAPAGRCRQDDTWPLEGHDGQRTSASAVCLEGPLRALWHATSTTPIRERPASFTHAVVTGREVIAVGLRGRASVLHALELTGAPRWSYDARHDMHWGYWPMVVGPLAALNDDPVTFVDVSSGQVAHRFGADSWGQMAADQERYYWTNTWHIHGPPLHLVAASIREPKIVWEQSRRGGPVAMDVKDDLGGVTLDGDAVFQVASYQSSPDAFVAAFAPATGQERWRRPARPAGFLSAASGRLYGVERAGKGERVVAARSQSDGEVAWTLPVPGALPASPLVSSGLVVVDSEPGVVVAIDAATGQERWRFDLGQKRRTQVGHETTLAAAANDTLVITAGKEVLLLALSTGQVRWRGALTDQPLHSPVLAGGRLYAVAGGEIWAFEGMGAL